MYTVIDFETTGLNHRECQIIEVGAIKLDHNIEPVARYHSLVKLRSYIKWDPIITEITGLVPADLENGVAESMALSMIRRFIDNDIIVAHNAPFELGFINRAWDPERWNRWICTRYLGHLTFPKINPSLKNLKERFYIRDYEEHRAMSDAIATVEIFRLMMKHVSNVEDIWNRYLLEPSRPHLYIPKNAEGFIDFDFKKFVN